MCFPLPGVTNLNLIFLQKACQTKIESRTDDKGDVVFQFVVRICTQLDSCENNAEGNSPKCFPGENNVSPF